MTYISEFTIHILNFVDSLWGCVRVSLDRTGTATTDEVLKRQETLGRL
jgi:hypothetical protein